MLGVGSAEAAGSLDLSSILTNVSGGGVLLSVVGVVKKLFSKALYGFQTGRIFCANSPSQQAKGASYNLLLLLRKTACSVVSQSATDRRPLRSVWNP